MVSATVSVNPVSAGSTTVITAQTAGGLAPYTYNYTGLPQGCPSSSTSTLACAPTQTGNFTIVISVVDGSGQHRSTTVLLTVQPAAGKSSSSVLGIPTTTLLLLLIIAVVAVVVVAAVVLRRHRNRGQAPPPPPPQWAPIPAQPPAGPGYYGPNPGYQPTPPYPPR